MIATITKLAERAFKANPDKALHSLQWYEHAGQFCAELDRDYQLEKGTAAGFVAALSPLNSWDHQLIYTPVSLGQCLVLIQQGFRPHEGIKGPGFFTNRDKAARILLGEKPLDVLGGDKVRRFYRNLCGDFEPVTIDRHAIAVAGWERSLTTRAYQRIEVAFKFAAENIGIQPAEIQALTWVYWRDLKNGRAW